MEEKIAEEVLRSYGVRKQEVLSKRFLEQVYNSARTRIGSWDLEGGDVEEILDMTLDDVLSYREEVVDSERALSHIREEKDLYGKSRLTGFIAAAVDRYYEDREEKTEVLDSRENYNGFFEIYKEIIEEEQ